MRAYSRPDEPVAVGADGAEQLGGEELARVEAQRGRASRSMPVRLSFCTCVGLGGREVAGEVDEAGVLARELLDERLGRLAEHRRELARPP